MLPQYHEPLSHYHLAQHHQKPFSLITKLRPPTQEERDEDSWCAKRVDWDGVWEARVMTFRNRFQNESDGDVWERIGCNCVNVCSRENMEQKTHFTSRKVSLVNQVTQLGLKDPIPMIAKYRLIPRFCFNLAAIPPRHNSMHDPAWDSRARIVRLCNLTV